MNGRAERGRGLAWLGLAVVVMLSAWIAWRVITLAMAHWNSPTDPGAALRWRVGQPEALLRRFGPLGDPGVGSEIQVSTARAGIRGAPLDGRGYRLLAQQAERNKDQALAATFYRSAAARGPRDLPSLGWLTNHAIAAGDYAMAFGLMDQMLRVEPELQANLGNRMIALFDAAPVQDALARVLEKSPPWRGYFLRVLIRRSKNSVALFGLVEHLRLSNLGLSEAELASWLNRLAGDRQWGAAYLTWVQSLPAEARNRVGNVFNGGFDWDPSNAGFDWRVIPVKGATVSRADVAGAGDNKALRIDFQDRRVPFKHVRQLLALPPGKYRLQGKVRLEDLRSERGLVWTLSCADDNRVIVQTSPMSGHRAWSPFVLDLVVPADGCGGQWLVLGIPARIAAEQRVGGTAWFDDIEIQAAAP